MTNTISNPTRYDVVLSQFIRDAAVAAVVKQKLSEAGLSVFAGSSLAVPEDGEQGSDFANSVWKALDECSALVALLTPAHRDSPSLTVEVGAAWMQRKPVYVLVEGSGSDSVPAHLRRFQVYPLAELSSLIPAIVKEAKPGASRRSQR
jgi:nucleoside 2-deoxyribosyltransferase